MHKQLLIWIIICLKGSGLVQAQWTQKDSLWLQNVLSGKDSLRLNPETMKAIQGGTFLNWETPSTPKLANPNKLSIIKDFSEYIHIDDTITKLSIKDMPAQVFMRRPWKEPKPDPRYQLSPQFYDFMKEFEHYNAPPTYDFNHLLSSLLSSGYRRHQRNIQNATKLQYYNNLPDRDMVKKQKEYEKQQRALPLPSVTRRDSITKRDSVVVVSDSVRIIRDSMLVLPPPTSQSSHGPDSLSLVTPADSAVYRKLPN